MPDSDEEDELNLPPPAKRRKFVFKKLGERIAEVDVDVHRQLSSVRAQPLEGCTSFFQEELQRWRELNTAEHFIQAAAILNNFTQSFPLLLHHKVDVVDTLLERVHMGAALSLEPLLALLGTLARDLQADFLPFLPRILSSFSQLVDEGAETEPELLQHVFQCLALICKHLVRPLAADLPHVLHHSSKLRYHRAPHVRQLSASTLAFLFRHATTLQMRAGVRTLLAEHAVQPREVRADGAGCMLAESCRGVGNGLHSKAPQLLATALHLDLLSASKMNAQKAGRGLTTEGLRDSAGEVVGHMLDHLLEHTRRGKLSALWSELLHTVERDLAAAENAADAGGAEVAQAARSLSHLAQAVEFHGGSRVEDYHPLMQLSARLCQPGILLPGSVPTGDALPGAESAGANASPPHSSADTDLPLLKQTLRFLTALLAGHSQEVGASRGPSGLRPYAPQWAPAFDTLRGDLLLPFLRALLQPPSGGAATAAVFAPQLLQALARLMLDPEGAAEVRDAALLLLAELCELVKPQGPQGSGRRLLEIVPQGVPLAEHLLGLVKGWSFQEGGGEHRPEVVCGKALCALHCLPYACSTSAEMLDAYDGLIEKAQAALKSAVEPVAALPLMAVWSDATVLKAALLSQQLIDGQRNTEKEEATAKLHAMVLPALLVVKEHSGVYCIVKAASEVLTLARDAGKQLDVTELEAVLPGLAPNLSSRSQAMRRDTLALLTAMAQPPVPGQEGPSEALAGLLRLERSQSMLSGGRANPGAIDHLKTAFEFRKVPGSLVGPVVRSLLGLLNIRLSYVWGPTSDALGSALQHEPAIAWPLVLDQLSDVQTIFLSASGAAIQPTEERSETSLGPSERLRAVLDAGDPSHSGGATDASVRLHHLLKAATQAPAQVLSKHGEEWVPLFLAYVASKTGPGDESAAEGEREERQSGGPAKGSAASIVSAVGGKSWRLYLKEWLAVVTAAKSPKSLQDSQQVQLAVASQLTDIDSGVQQAALKCLKNWKLKFLGEHMDRLLRLVDDSHLREELTSFPLAKSASDGILEQHRPGLLRVLVRVLWPKMRKRSGRLAGRGAPGSARAAILNFLAAADPEDMVPLVQLFVQPLAHCLRAPATAGAKITADGLFEEAWWVEHLGREPAEWWLARLSSGAQITELPLRVKTGFLNAAGDLLQHLGHRLHPYLPELCSFMVRLLQSATLDQEGGNSMEGCREVRSLVLRLFANLLQRFPDGIDFNPLWQPFFAAAEPLMQRLPTEVSADRVPPLLEVASSMAASPHLLPLLADRASLAAAEDRDLATALAGRPPPQAWAADQQLGSRLLGATIEGLGASHCAQPARDAALGVVEAVLEYGNEAAEKLLGRHMEHLLEALRGIAVAGHAGPRPKQAAKVQKGQVSGKKTSLRSLAILEQLSSLTSSPEMSERLVDALLPMLLQNAGKRKGRGRVDEAMIVRILNVLAAIWKHQAETGQASGVQGRLLGISDTLAPLAGTLQDRQAGIALAAVFTGLSRLEPALQPAATVLQGLLAVSSDAIDEVDYDARLAAYRSLNPAAWSQVSGSGGAPVLLQRCFQDLRDGDDLALRHAAAQALSRFLEAAENSAGQLGGDKDLLMKVVFPNAKRAISAANLAVRQEHLTLLRKLCMGFPGRFNEMHALTHPDIEVDFFANVAHLQMHRRIRALHRLVKVLKEDKLGPGVLLGVAMPLLSQMIVEGRSEELSGHELKDADKDREANVVDTAVQTLGEVARHLAWPHYQQLLGHFLKAMQRLGEGNKAVIRAVCAIIDSFHFKVELEEDATPAVAPPQLQGPPESAELAAETAAAVEGVGEGLEAEEGPDAGEVTFAGREEAEAASGREILGALTKRVLPVLQSVLVVKRGERVRSSVALALVKLLRLLPPIATRSALPQALQGVANLLRNRLQRIRDDARNVMSAMVSELGPQYLGFALDVLESAVPEKGYMGHIRGYTLQYLLEGLSKRMEPGALDACLARILPMIESQVFGGVSEEKEAGAFAGTREAKRLRAYDTYQMLAQGMTFSTQLANLLSLVKSRLHQAGDPASRAKLSLLLEAAQKGVAQNVTATPEHVLVFVSGVMESVVPAEAAAVQRAEAAAEAASRGEADGEEDAADAKGESAANRHQHLLLQFALTLVQRGMKKGTLGGSSPRMLTMLDPLLPLLVACLRSRHTQVVEPALRILSRLVQLPLPGLTTAAPGAGAAMTDLLRNSPSTTTPIAQECLRLLASLLRTCPEWAPTTTQLRFLVTWALTDVEEAAAHVAAFALLRGIIKRRLVLPEVYDVMGKVEDLMIRSQSAPVRQLCSSTLLQFLLDYPVGDKRFQQHMHKLIANLSYEHESGRLAGIDMLTVLTSKLPPALLEQYADVVFLPLVARLVGDASAKCRQEVGSALVTLFKAVEPPQFASFLQFCAKWLGGEDTRLRRAAVQTLGIMAELDTPQFGKRIRPLIPRLTAVLASHSVEEGSEVTEVDADGEQGPGAPQAWQEAYYTLSLLLNIAKHSPRELRWGSGEAARSVWTSLPGLVLHRHLWVRKLAADLFGTAFADPAIWEALLAEEATGPSKLAALFYQQMETGEAKEADLAQAAKCLVFLSLHLYQADEAASRLPSQHAVTKEAEREDKESKEEVRVGPQLSLHGLMRRMARLADNRTYPRQRARLTALRFLAAVTTRLGPEKIEPFLPLVLRPLFRITEGLSPNSKEVVELAQEVIAHIRQAAGPDALLDAFNQAMTAVKTARAERKRQQAVQMMLDPQAAARKKLQKSVRSAAAKKRKMEDISRKRSAGAIIKNKKPRKQAGE